MRSTIAAARECPVAPPDHASVYARALHRACVVVGGVAQLADHLEVDAGQLVHWMTGGQEPPERVFLAAVEVVLLHASGGGRA